MDFSGEISPKDFSFVRIKELQAPTRPGYEAGWHDTELAFAECWTLKLICISMICCLLGLCLLMSYSLESRSQKLSGGIGTGPLG